MHNQFGWTSVIGLEFVWGSPRFLQFGHSGWFQLQIIELYFQTTRVRIPVGALFFCGHWTADGFEVWQHGSQIENGSSQLECSSASRTIFSRPLVIVTYKQNSFHRIGSGLSNGSTLQRIIDFFKQVQFQLKLLPGYPSFSTFGNSEELLLAMNWVYDWPGLYRKSFWARIQGQ